MSDAVIDRSPALDRPSATGPDGGATAVRHDRGVRLERAGRTADLHPRWLRDRTREPGAIEPANGQRLFTPRDIDPAVTVTDCRLTGDDLDVSFSDGHRAHLPLLPLVRDLGWIRDPEAPPEPQPWPTPVDVPRVDWAGVGRDAADADPDAVLAMLDAFYRNGFVVLHGLPAQAGTVERVAGRLGYLVATNFGRVFDVRREDAPTDLAYTSIELPAHTDQPYRQQPPAVQLLHCLANAAHGGDSTLADGLAASLALQAHDPAMHRALTDVEVDFRYDTGSDTVVGTRPLLDHDRRGRFRAIHLSTKLDTPLPRGGDDLEAWYAGRRWLTEWTDDPGHQVRLHLGPGEVLVMDNHRVLHGRGSFDSASGRRHLQGCYIGLDGPDTLYRLTARRRAAALDR